MLRRPVLADDRVDAMRRLLAGALLAAGCCHAAPWRRVWHVAEAALIAGTSADAASSYGLRELNPGLGTGRFGASQAAIKLGVAGALLAVEHVAVRKSPRAAKPFAILDLVGAGVFGAAAVHNERLR